jgi:intracellular multiplication protein IcmO
MAKYVQRGLDREQEQDYRRLVRDVRTLGQRFVDFFKNPESVTIVIVIFAVTSIFVPTAADYFFIMGIGSFLAARIQKVALPFRLPCRAKGMKDYNNPQAGSGKPGKADGIYFFGNDKKNSEELWFSNEDMRTHVLMFGSTGSGKTEALLSISYNALIQSSGFIYVDGKGDNSLFSKVFSMVRYMGREDDLLLINFMTGARDIVGPQKRRLSNTMNPFARGSSSMLSQLIISLMESSSQSPSGDMWKGRAMAFVEALMKILVAMRDAEFILLDANVIRNYFPLERLEAMVIDKVFIRDGGLDPINIENFPPVVLEPIANYLSTLPGYQRDKRGKQVSQVYEQHGFITMQLTRVFTSLADTYGHIMRTRLAEVDLRDVVLNRRILVVLLPALEKSPEELSNLGKVIVSSLKVMMASGLGEEVEGKYSDVVGRKPTNARTPYLCVLDEYGYYAVQGFAIVPAQARSLGFSVIFAGQDLPALQRASKEEAATIGANTNIKICMKLEDPLETWDFFMKTAGESYVSHVGGFQANVQSVTGQYTDTQSAQMEKRARVDLLDLKEQGLGEAHIFFKSRIIRSRMFYANPKPIKEMRLNHYLKVDPPSDAIVRTIHNAMYYFETALRNKASFDNATSEIDKEMEGLTSLLHAESSALSPVERCSIALRNYYQQQVAAIQIDDSTLPPTEIDIFNKLNITEYLQSLLLAGDKENFSKPILDRQLTRSQIAYIERLDGKPEIASSKVGQEIVTDLQTATHYPPIVTHVTTGEELKNTIEVLIEHIVIKKQESNTTKS